MTLRKLFERLKAAWLILVSREYAVCIVGNGTADWWFCMEAQKIPALADHLDAICQAYGDTIETAVNSAAVVDEAKKIINSSGLNNA